MPLAKAECSLITAAVDMATLLLEQTKLYDSLQTAEAEAETVKRLMDGHRRKMSFSRLFDERNLN
jgi:hypothetical protein